MFATFPRHTAILAAALLSLDGGLPPAQAQDASAWQKEAHGAARLIAGTTVNTPAATFVRAGVEIQLDPGWHTYWRYPGDTGVPPTFSFAGSKNAKSVNVLWPAPVGFPDGAGGNSIGYLGQVILPLHVVQATADQPTFLHVKLNYAVCATLCVPAHATLELPLTGESADEPLLEAAEQLVPKRVALGVDPGNGLAIRSAQLSDVGGQWHVIVDVAAPAGAPVTLFVEGPTPDWALPMPEPVGGVDGPDRRFMFALDGVPPGAHAKGAQLTLTAVSGSHAIEVSARLD